MSYPAFMLCVKRNERYQEQLALEINWKTKIYLLNI